MKLFINSACINEIKDISGWGIISGVSTNPSLIAKEKKDLKPLIDHICNLVDGPVMLGITKTTTEAMVKKGREYSNWHSNIVISLPMTKSGIKAAKILSNDGIKTNITLIFSVNQAIMAALAGATYITPFMGRTDDIGHDGVSLIKEIKEVFKNYVFGTQILASGIRNQIHITEAAKVGIDATAVPYDILKQMFLHPLTEEGINKSQNDWSNFENFRLPETQIV